MNETKCETCGLPEIANIWTNPNGGPAYRFHSSFHEFVPAPPLLTADVQEAHDVDAARKNVLAWEVGSGFTRDRFTADVDAYAAAVRGARDEEWARDQEVKDAADAENLHDWINACNRAEARIADLEAALRRVHHIMNSAYTRDHAGRVRFAEDYNAIGIDAVLAAPDAPLEAHDA